MHRPTLAFRQVGHLGTKCGVRTHSTGYRDPRDTQGAAGFVQFSKKDVDDALLERCAEVRQFPFHECRVLGEALTNDAVERGLDPTETHVEAIYSGRWKAEAIWIPGTCMRIDQGPSGIGQAKDLRALVEGLPSGVVHGGAHHLHVQLPPDQNDQRMPAAHGQVEKGERRRHMVPFVADEMGKDMGLHVVNPEQGIPRP